MEEKLSPFICVDSDVIIDALRGNYRRLSDAREKGTLCTTTQNVFELFKGAFLYPRNFELQKVQQFLQGIPVLLPSLNSSKEAAQIFASLKHRGLELSDGDVLIAAICIEHNCALLTNNKKHFSRIKGLKLI